MSPETVKSGGREFDPAKLEFWSVTNAEAIARYFGCEFPDEASKTEFDEVLVKFVEFIKGIKEVKVTEHLAALFEGDLRGEGLLKVPKRSVLTNQARLG